MREGTNNQDEEEARQVIASLNGASIPLAEYSTKNQYGQFTFVVSRPDGIYGTDILEPSNADVGYIVYNQYGTSWFKKRTCDTLLAAGRRGVHLLLVGDHLADIDPTSPDIGTPAARTEFEACISELTHLVPLPPNTAAPTTVTGLLGAAASPPVPYLDALRTSALFSPAADVTAATAPLAAGTTPVAVAFERTPDGARTIAMNFRISRAATADGRQRLTEGLTAAMVALRGCSRDPFVRIPAPVCTAGATRNQRQLVNGIECSYFQETCVDGASWQDGLVGDGQCPAPSGPDVSVWRFFVDTNLTPGNPRRDYLYPTAPAPIPGFTLDPTIAGGAGAAAFQSFSVPSPLGDSVPIFACRHEGLDSIAKHYLAPGACDPATITENNGQPVFYVVSHKFRNGYRLVHFLNTDSEFAGNGLGGGKFHAVESPANMEQITDLRRGIDGVGSGWLEYTSQFPTAFVYAAQ